MAFQQLAAAQVSAEVPINENNTALGQAFAFSKNSLTTTGLTQGFNGGNFNVTTVADGAVALTASTTNYLVVHRTTLAVTSATATTNWNNSTTYGRMGRGVTSASAITTYTDERYSPGGIFAAAGSASPVTSVAGRTGAVVIVAADLADFAETVDDRVAALVVGSGGVRETYDDAGNALTLDAEQLVNAQVGITYTYLTGDRAKLVTHSNAAAIAGTLPVAGGTFASGWFMDVQNRGAGTLTITPTTSTIDGAASLALTTNQGVRIASDGANYFTQRGIGGAGGSVATDVIWDVAGDLVQGTGANTGARLSIGTALQVLRVNAGATAVEWAAAASGSGTKSYGVFTAMTSQPPAANFATLDTRNSIAVLDFDDTTAEGATWVSVMPEAASLASGLSMRIHWMATTAVANAVMWEVSIEKMDATDLDVDSFDTILTGAGTASATGGITTTTAITLTTIDAVVAGSPFRLKLRRLPADAGDTMVGDAELVAVEMRSAA